MQRSYTSFHANINCTLRQVVANPFSIVPDNQFRRDFNFTIGSTPVRIRFRANAWASTIFSTSIVNFLIDNVRYVNTNGPNCDVNFSCATPYCTPVKINGDPKDKIDVVFVGSGFPNLPGFAKVVDDMIDYDGNDFGIMHYEPFKSDKNKFNFWRVDRLQTFNGGVVQDPLGFWHHDTRYEAQAKELVVDYCGSINEYPTQQFVALMVTPRVRSHATNPGLFGVGSGGSFVTIGQEYIDNTGWALDLPTPPKFPSLNIDINGYGDSRVDVIKTAVHEFGHSFGGLIDEYNSMSNGIIPIDFVPNCSSTPLLGGYACMKWRSICPQSDPQCCLAGCGFANWYRPYANSLMRSHYVSGTTFLPVNDFELEKDINSYLPPESASNPSELSYKIIINYSDGNLTLINVSILNQSTLLPINQPKDHKLKLFSSSGETLFDVNFLMPIGGTYSPSKDWFDANGNQIFTPGEGPIINYSDVNVIISAPYFPGGKEARIFDTNGNMKIVIDLSSFASRIIYSNGYGGKDISSASYKTRYALTPQPIGTLNSTNYVSYLGPIPSST